MTEILKPDGLTNRIRGLDDNTERLTTSRRRLLHVPSFATNGTNSTSYVDLGPSYVDLRPGSSGRWLVGIDVDAEDVPPGDALYVSFRMIGPTTVGSDDGRAWILSNSGANADAIRAASTRFVRTPVVADGLYTFTMTIKSYTGLGVSVQGRGLIIQPM